MTTNTKQFEVGATVEFRGEIYKVAAYVRGWYELTNEDNVAKARAKDITAVVGDVEPDGKDNQRRMARTLAEHKPNYVKQHSHSGNNSQSNGDLVAQYLLGDDPQTACAKTELLIGLPIGTLMQLYGHLNPGQIRMNAGNRIRGALKRGDITEKQLEA